MPISPSHQQTIVFLDIDDVLCVHPSLNAPEVVAALAGDATADSEDVLRQIFNAEAVENLRLLHCEFEPLYVISSSWTLHLDRQQLCETFRRTGLKFVTENLHEHWCTPRDDDSYRLVEIDAWLDTHALLPPVAYAIIDDVVSGQSIPGSHLEARSVLCEAAIGFMRPQLRQAQEVLRTQLAMVHGVGELKF